MSEHPSQPPTVIISARKVSTGEVRVNTLRPYHPLIRRVGEDNAYDLANGLLFELESNNWSCDCNRCLFFDEGFPENCREEEYAVDWFSVNGRRFEARDDYGRSFSDQPAPCLADLNLALLEQDIRTIRKIIEKGGTAADVMKFLDTPQP